MNTEDTPGCMFPVFAMVALAMFIVYYFGMRQELEELEHGASNMQKIAYFIAGRDEYGNFVPQPGSVTVTEIEDDDPTEYYQPRVMPKEEPYAE